LVVNWPRWAGIPFEVSVGGTLNDTNIGEFMKTILLALGIQVFAIYAIAGGAGAPVSRSGEVQCRAYDAGTEEHSSAHFSCGECLSIHGDCDMRCYSYETSCTAKGQRQNHDANGNVVLQDERSSSVERNEYRARDMAIYQCINQGLINCQIESCNQSSSMIQNTRCQRGAADVSGSIIIRH
jgi:hypothetical protein